MTIKNVLISLISCCVCGREVNKELEKYITPEAVPEIYKLADKHDMAHIVSKALWDLGASHSDALRKKQMMAIYRYEKINAAYISLCDTFEAVKIPFLPLKGSFLRQYYPEPWMRTSCDIDILVHEDDLETAAIFLEEKLHYKKGIKGTHDMSMYSPTGVHLELHYKTMEERDSQQMQTVLDAIWQYAVPEAGCTYQYRLTDEMFYFFHIAHMAKHLCSGGCGIKPFLDLWIINHRMEHDAQKRKELAERGGLLTFATTAEKLSEVWFSGEEADAVSGQLEHYILNGGVYGSTENSVAVKRTQKSKLKYVLSKVFVPWNTLKHYYPVLHKHRWLTPFCNVQRWFRLVFTKDVKHSVRTLKANASVSADEIAATADLLKNIGL